jgi:hypothetical protein
MLAEDRFTGIKKFLMCRNLMRMSQLGSNGIGHPAPHDARAVQTRNSKPDLASGPALRAIENSVPSGEARARD